MTTGIDISQNGRVVQSPHVSKGSGYALVPDDWVEVRTPGGGGWGIPRSVTARSSGAT